MVKRIVSIDFETYYGDDWRLGDTKKGDGFCTMEQYVRGDKFEAILLSAKVDDGQVINAVGEEEIGKLLRDLGLDRLDTLTIAHNMAFDGSICEWRFGVPIENPVCTVAMARDVGIGRVSSCSLNAVTNYLREAGYPVGFKGRAVQDAFNVHLKDMTPEFLQSYIAYCQQDTVITKQIFDIMLPKVSSMFIEAIGMTLKMYTRPTLELNRPLLEEYLQDTVQTKEDKFLSLAFKHGFGSVEELTAALRSGPKFAKLLKSLNVVPPKKVSEKKTATARAKDPEASEVMTFAFSKDDLEMQNLLKRARPEVKEIIEAKFALGSSIAESRTKTFIDLSFRGYMPVPLEYAQAHTGRYGGSGGYNLQNLPKRKGDKTLREAIMAPQGYEIVAADSSQVEARCLAYVANQQDMLDIFKAGKDPYSYMASDIYHETPETIYHYAKEVKPLTEDEKALVKLNKWRRDIGKETVLASGYNMSGNAFADRLLTQGIEFEMTQGEREAWLRYYAREHGVPKEAHEFAMFQDAYEVAKYEHHLAEAQRINSIYRAKNASIKRFWQICTNVLTELIAGGNGWFGGPNNDLFFYDGEHQVFGTTVPGIRLPNGYWILYPKLHSYIDEETGRLKYAYEFKDTKNKTFTKHIYGGALTENLMQGLAFAILTWQAIRINRAIPVKMNVHDEWASVVPVTHRNYARDVFCKYMREVPDWVEGLPLDCEFSYGLNYAQC